MLLLLIYNNSFLYILFISKVCFLLHHQILKLDSYVHLFYTVLVLKITVSILSLLTDKMNKKIITNLHKSVCLQSRKKSILIKKEKTILGLTIAGLTIRFEQY